MRPLVPIALILVFGSTALSAPLPSLPLPASDIYQVPFSIGGETPLPIRGPPQGALEKVPAIVDIRPRNTPFHPQADYDLDYLYSRGHKSKKSAPPKHAAPSKSAHAPAPGSPPKKPHLSVGQKIRNFFHRVGQKIKSGFQKFGRKVKEGFQKFGRKVKAGFQKFGQKVKAGFKKVGHWFKTTGLKIVKFGLKVVSTIGSVVGKAVGFVCKPLGQAIEAGSKGVSVAADKIPAKLSPKLEKGMKIMDAIQDPIGYAAKKAAAKAMSHAHPGSTSAVPKKSHH